MTRNAGNLTWLHRFSVFTCCATFCLVVAGGLVTSTGSGLAVPDWPLSYGQVMPPMIGGIFYEHGHRLIATFVGILTTILALWLWRSDDRRWVRVLGFVALAAVVLQGVLGGLTVLYLLPTPISVAHATLAQSFFSFTILLSLATSKGWREHTPPDLHGIRRTRRLAIVATVAVMAQLVLGAWMRHSNAGLAIPDFPLSYGELLPPQGRDGLASINMQRMELYDLPPVDSGQVWVHFAHRVGAGVATIAICVLGVHVLTKYRSDQRLREPAVVMLALVLVQVLLGALTVWTGKGVQISTAHVATGALLLGSTVVVAARSFQLYRIPAMETRSSLSPQPSRS